MKIMSVRKVQPRAVACLLSLIGILLAGCDEDGGEYYDVQAVITILEPTAEEEWTTTGSSIRLAGSMEYAPRAYITNNRTGKTYTGTVDTDPAPFLWHVEITDLQIGENPITVQAHLYNDGSAYDYITITRTQ